MTLGHRITRWWLSLCIACVAATMVLTAAPADAQRRRRDGAREQAAPQPAHVIFDLLPEGAEVLIDEHSVGVGPLGPVEVQAGEHSVRVRLQGFTEYTDVVVVEGGQDFHVPVDLIPLSHVVAIESTPPGARVFVDDQFSGETPTDVELFDGEHTLRLTLRGFEDVTRTITAVAGQHDTWSVPLQALPEQAAAQWYEDPLVWIIAGASVVAVAVATVVIVLVAQPSPSQLEQFCNTEQGCIRFDPPF